MRLLPSITASVRSGMCHLSGTNISVRGRGIAEADSILPEGCDMGFFNWAAPLVRLYGNRFDAGDAERIALMLRPAVDPGGRILDVGGGAGQLAHLLAEELGARVTVVDPTPEMLAHVSVDERVEAVLGIAEDLPFADGSFDALVVSDAFHHFRDQDRAVQEFARVVRHNGLVLVLELDPKVRPMPLVAYAERLMGEPGAFMTPVGMCGFMARRGIEGRCEVETRWNYRFLGCVQKPVAR
ncbi:MAG: class I SAM-dependent methyltransferase [Coriobacteriia bacterium]